METAKSVAIAAVLGLVLWWLFFRKKGDAATLAPDASSGGGGGGGDTIAPPTAPPPGPVPTGDHAPVDFTVVRPPVAAAFLPIKTIGTSPVASIVKSSTWGMNMLPNPPTFKPPVAATPAPAFATRLPTTSNTGFLR